VDAAPQRRERSVDDGERVADLVGDHRRELPQRREVLPLRERGAGPLELRRLRRGLRGVQHDHRAHAEKDQRQRGIDQVGRVDPVHARGHVDEHDDAEDPERGRYHRRPRVPCAHPQRCQCSEDLPDVDDADDRQRERTDPGIMVGDTSPADGALGEGLEHRDARDEPDQRRQHTEGDHRALDPREPSPVPIRQEREPRAGVGHREQDADATGPGGRTGTEAAGQGGVRQAVEGGREAGERGVPEAPARGGAPEVGPEDGERTAGGGRTQRDGRGEVEVHPRARLA